jgi:hypothetical protein
MADTTEQTVETSQNGLMDFNWDESGADSFFGLNEFGEEPKPIEEKTPKPVVQTTPPPVTETIESDKEEVEKQEELSFFEEEDKTKKESTTDNTFYEDVYKDLKEAGIFKHVELEDGEELDADRLFELQQEEIEAEVTSRLDAWASQELDEDAKAFIKFKIQGGDTSEFFKTYQNTSEITLGDIEDEDYQDSLIRYQLQKEGWDRDEIEDRLEFLTESNKKSKFAERYHDRLIKEQEKEKQALVKQAEEQKIRAKQQEEQFRVSIKDTLDTNKEINGIKFTDKDKGNLINFLTKREKLEDGRVITGFQRKLSESFNDPKKIALLAKILNDDFDFSSFEKSAITKKTKEIKRNIEQRQSMRPTGSGSSSGANSLASLFDK